MSFDGLFEQFVLARGVIEHEIEQDLHIPVVGFLDETFEVFLAAQIVGDGVEVRDIVAVIEVVVLQHRRKPQRVQAQILNVVQFLDDRFEDRLAFLGLDESADVQLVAGHAIGPLRRDVQAVDAAVGVDRDGVRDAVLIADGDAVDSDRFLDGVERGAELVALDLVVVEFVAVVDEELDVEVLVGCPGCGFGVSRDDDLVADQFASEADPGATTLADLAAEPRACAATTAAPAGSPRDSGDTGDAAEAAVAAATWLVGDRFVTRIDANRQFVRAVGRVECDGVDSCLVGRDVRDRVVAECDVALFRRVYDGPVVRSLGVRIPRS